MNENLMPPQLRGVVWELRVIPELAAMIRHRARPQRTDAVSVSRDILLIPGFGASDWMMEPLKRYLQSRGHRVQSWGLGRNTGNIPALLPKLRSLIGSLVEEKGHAIDVVGWSLGGYLAREVARDHPQWFRQLITLGSPVVGGPKYTVMADYYRRKGVDIEALANKVAERATRPLSIPVTVIYTRSDAIVGWQACLDRKTPCVRHIEVKGSHTGLVYRPQTQQLIARCLDDLAQWSGMDSEGRERLV